MGKVAEGAYRNLRVKASDILFKSLHSERGLPLK